VASEYIHRGMHLPSRHRYKQQAHAKGFEKAKTLAAERAFHRARRTVSSVSQKIRGRCQAYFIGAQDRLPHAGVGSLRNIYQQLTTNVSHNPSEASGHRLARFLQSPAEELAGQNPRIAPSSRRNLRRSSVALSKRASVFGFEQCLAESNGLPPESHVSISKSCIPRPNHSPFGIRIAFHAK
jgi:hypothetical protein